MVEKSIFRINKGKSYDAIKNALLTLKNFENGTLIQKNAVFTDYLQNGISARYTENGEERSTLIYLVDWENIDNNSFICANQWTFIENSNRRPDILLFINGLPLVLIEALLNNQNISSAKWKPFLATNRQSIYGKSYDCSLFTSDCFENIS